MEIVIKNVENMIKTVSVLERRRNPRVENILGRIERLLLWINASAKIESKSRKAHKGDLNGK